MAISTLKAKLLALKNKSTTQHFFVWNKWLAALYLVQALAIVLFSKARLIPVEASYQAKDALGSSAVGETVYAVATNHLFDSNMVYVVATFLFVTALVHGLLAFTLRKRYELELAEGRNAFRWLGYAVSHSFIVVAVALLCGIHELAVLVLLVGLVIGANLIGLALERQGKSFQRLLYAIGGIAGLLPWLVIGGYLVAAGVYDGSVPGYVYALFASAFILSGAVAVNLFLLARRKGAWKDYLYGERIYIVINLAIQTAVAWQIFAGLLRP